MTYKKTIDSTDVETVSATTSATYLIGILMFDDVVERGWKWVGQREHGEGSDNGESSKENVEEIHGDWCDSKQIFDVQYQSQ